MWPIRLAVGTGVAVLVAALLPAAAGTAGASRVSLCRASQLELKLGPDVSAATGQNPFTVRLTNGSRVACALGGYPVVSFSDRRGRIPFVVRDGGGHGGDQQVTLNSPRRVLIRPGGAAYVILNKFRCDLGSLRVASRMRLALPVSAAGSVGSISLRSLGAAFSYCRRVSTFNVVSVSPFVASVAAGLRHY